VNTSVVHLLQDHANFWNASLAKSTKDTYQVGVRRYLRFCAQLRVAPFPLSERVLELFATSLARCVGHKTIRTYLLGAQARNFDLGFWQPLSSFHRLAFLLRGIRRSQGSSHSRPVRAPVSLAGLQKVVAFVRWHRSGFDASMLSAALLAAFFGLLRASEYTSPSARTWWPRLTLSAADVSFDGRLGVASIRIKVSKTDPFGAGTVVRIVASGGVFCPYAALLRFSQMRGSFPGPFFVYSDGSLLTRGCIAALLKSVLPGASLNSHSLRRGGASALAAMGYPAYVIQLVGRWRSSAFLRYIEFDDNFIRTAQRRMADLSTSCVFGT
jgi:hypothetical protein